MKTPEILFDLHSGKKFESNPHILKDDFRKMQSRYKNNQQRTSDGGNGNHSVSRPIILIKIKVDQMLPSSYISSLLVSIL